VPVGFLAAHNRITDVPINSLARSVKPHGTDVFVQHARLGAAQATPWHTHPGTAIVTVIAGALTCQNAHANQCRNTPYLAGSGFVDPGHGHVHRAIAGPEGADFDVTYLLPPGWANHLITANGRYWARTVIPSLSTGGSVRVSSLMLAQSAWLSGISRRANT
jgi:hypothetical protein